MVHTTYKSATEHEVALYANSDLNTTKSFEGLIRTFHDFFCR